METTRIQCPAGVQVKGSTTAPFEDILTFEALDFVKKLHERFDLRRKELLRKREEKQHEIDEGNLPHFLEETRDIREEVWTIDPVPADLQDRRVEITGPAGNQKMVVNAFNSGAHMYMADFEDANSPTWQNTIQGQVNLRDAINRRIDFVSPEGKAYRLNEKVATLIVRPRGWHLVEKHILVHGEPVSGSLVDFGLFFFHNAKYLLENGTGPYFYLPKLESHLEARLWNDVFIYVQKELGIDTIARFQDELGEMGYKFQFVTLAGFHALNHSMFELARKYKEHGMAAYSELQQAEFASEAYGYTATKHQREVGTGYFDEVAQVISGGTSSTIAMKGSTEEAQFTS